MRSAKPARGISLARMCSEALEFWNQSELDYAPVRVEEYEALLEELKNELLQKVHNFKRIG